MILVPLEIKGYVSKPVSEVEHYYLLYFILSDDDC